MRLVVALCLLAATMACEDDRIGSSIITSSGGNGSIAGVYPIRSVNGKPLPVARTAGGVTSTLTSDTLTVTNGGTWSEVYHMNRTVSGASTDDRLSMGGTYVLSGSVLTMSTGTSIEYSGTFISGSFTLYDGQDTFIFSR